MVFDESTLASACSGHHRASGSKGEELFESKQRDLAEEARRKSAAQGDDAEEGEGDGTGVQDADDSAEESDEASDSHHSATPDIRGDRPDEALAIRLARPTKPSPLAEMSYGYMLPLLWRVPVFSSAFRKGVRHSTN